MWGWVLGAAALYLITRPSAVMAPAPPVEKKINLPEGSGASISIPLGGRVAVTFTVIPTVGRIVPTYQVVDGNFGVTFDDDPRNEDRAAIVTPQGKGHGRVIFSVVDQNGGPMIGQTFFDLEVT